MISLIFASMFVFNFIEVGLSIGTNTPISNLERFFSTAAFGSVYLAKELNGNKFSLSYEKSRLSGISQPTYQLQLDRISLEYGHSIHKRKNWSLPFFLGISNIWVRRQFQTYAESGIIQAGDIGIGFQEDISRMRFGAKFFVTGLYSLASRKTAAYIFGLRVNLGYEF